MTDVSDLNVDDLARTIRAFKPGAEPISTQLQTSTRVIRHVTDGIYREPWAALRELISNAYDADATTVTISTDAPRFSRVTISDDGNGFTAEAIASMCRSIGGSQKRTGNGATLGVTKAGQPDRSPAGRKLIGKLGIGLFAVSQLTQRFRIITKVANENTRTVAEIFLFRNVESPDNKSGVDTSGNAVITRIPASDVSAHGTDIVIDELLPRTRDEFRSQDMWDLSRSTLDPDEESSVQLPRVHIGLSDPIDQNQFKIPPQLPWAATDTPLQKFATLVDVFHETFSAHKPSLSNTFDNYFKFAWYLSLCAPLDYVDKHPYDLDSSSGIRFFRLGSRKGGQATEIALKEGQTLREAVKLPAPERGDAGEFRVFLDALELRRPIRYTALPPTSHRIQNPLMFIGSEAPNISAMDPRKTGGTLRFDGYLLWYPRIIPTDHLGVIIRVGDSSGALFDSTFLNYRVSEQTRREQVTGEIFVHEGMDVALHIDRESFNTSHPHYQYVASWVHSSFRQFATKHKALGSDASVQNRAALEQKSLSKIEQLASAAVNSWTDGATRPTEVVFDAKKSHGVDSRGRKSIVLDLSTVFPAIASIPKGRRNPLQAKLAAIMQILDAAGLLGDLPSKKQIRLARDIAAVLCAEEE